MLVQLLDAATLAPIFEIQASYGDLTKRDLKGSFGMPKMPKMFDEKDGLDWNDLFFPPGKRAQYQDVKDRSSRMDKYVRIGR